MLQALNILIYPFLFLSLFAQVFILSSFLSGKKKMREEEEFEMTDFPKVTIAVPCWNEAKTLARTIDSLMSSHYPKDKLEILIGDNNSTDDTLKIAHELKDKYQGVCEIKIFRQEKQGKHHVINTAIDMASTEYFGCLDADSTIARDAINKNMKYFASEETMASTSCVKIEYPQHTWIQKLQSTEYLVGVFIRKAYGTFDAIQVAPGPLTIYRKKVFEMIGKFKDGHKVEDFEMTVRMHRHGLKIANSHKAFVYTLGPSTLKGYINQRVRWVRGGIENIIDNRDMMFNKKYGHFGLFVMPTVSIFIFYAVYALFFLFFNIYRALSYKVELWSAYDYSFSAKYFLNSVRDFDLFYFNTNIILFISVVMLTIYMFAIYMGKEIAESHRGFYKNLALYFFVFPYLSFWFLGKSIIHVLTRKKAVWILQDNKVSESVTTVRE